MAVRDFAFHAQPSPNPSGKPDVAEQLSRLESFRDLHPGWDSYEAEPPNATALENARRILLFLRDSESQLPVRVVPSADGGVTLVFSKDGARYADIECFNDGDVLAITSEPAQEPTIWPLTPDEEGFRTALRRIIAFLDA